MEALLANFSDDSGGEDEVDGGPSAWTKLRELHQSNERQQQQRRRRLQRSHGSGNLDGELSDDEDPLESLNTAYGEYDLAQQVLPVAFGFLHSFLELIVLIVFLLFS